MSKCHHTDSRKPLGIALVFAFIFMVFEALFGYIANSLSLMSDALHMFTDVGALVLSLFISYVAKRSATLKMSFGYGRAEVLGALASSLSIWALSCTLIYQSLFRLFNPEPVEGGTVLIVALLGLVANLAMMRVLHSSQAHNLNVRAAYLHVLGDVLGSLGVIISGLVLWLTDWSPVDPLITIVFTLIMLFTSGKMIKKTTLILMEGAPEEIDTEEVLQTLLSLPSVKEARDLHLWSISSSHLSLSVHLFVEELDAKLLPQIKAILQEKYSITQTAVQIQTLIADAQNPYSDCTSYDGKL